jgi:hypothetical protein
MPTPCRRRPAADALPPAAPASPAAGEDTIDARIRAAEVLRAAGNESFKAADYQAATRRYNVAIRSARGAGPAA